MKSKNVSKRNKYLFVGSVLLIAGLASIFSQRFRHQLVKTLPSPTGTASTVTGVVAKVIDGDSIVLSTGENIRYIGINTPEIENGECFATESAKVNSDLVLGKTVTLVKDTSETDKYGRLLRYVYEGDTFVNDYLVKNGYARLMTIFPDTGFENQFTNSENYARQNSLGLWKKCKNTINTP